MEYEGPLSASLLRMRTARLFGECLKTGSDVGEIVWHIVYCDNCGTTVNRLREPAPLGWTTSGSTEDGWRDLCKECSS